MFIIYTLISYMFFPIVEKKNSIVSPNSEILV